MFVIALRDQVLYLYFVMTKNSFQFNLFR